MATRLDTMLEATVWPLLPALPRATAGTAGRALGVKVKAWNVQGTAGRNMQGLV
jgi:hypothetical protein